MMEMQSSGPPSPLAIKAREKYGDETDADRMDLVVHERAKNLGTTKASFCLEEREDRFHSTIEVSLGHHMHFPPAFMIHA